MDLYLESVASAVAATVAQHSYGLCCGARFVSDLFYLY